MPASAGKCAQGEAINVCAYAGNHKWVRCVASSVPGYAEYKEDPTCAVYEGYKLPDGSLLTVDLENTATSPKDMPSDLRECYNNAVRNIKCGDIPYGSCSTNKDYICDCGNYRYPTLRKTTQAEKAQCGTGKQQFVPPAVEKALAEKQAAVPAVPQTVPAEKPFCEQNTCVIEVAGGSGKVIKQNVGVTSPYAGSCPSDCAVFGAESGNKSVEKLGHTYESFCSADGSSVITKMVPTKGLYSEKVLNWIYGNILRESEIAQICASRICSAGRCVEGAVVIGLAGPYVCLKGQTCDVYDAVSGMVVKQKVVFDEKTKQYNTEIIRGSVAAEQERIIQFEQTYTQNYETFMRANGYSESYISEYKQYRDTHPDALIADFTRYQLRIAEQHLNTLVNLGNVEKPDEYLKQVSEGKIVASQKQEALDGLPLSYKLLLKLNDWHQGGIRRGDNIQMKQVRKFQEATGIKNEGVANTLLTVMNIPNYVTLGAAGKIVEWGTAGLEKAGLPVEENLAYVQMLNEHNRASFMQWSREGAIVASLVVPGSGALLPAGVVGRVMASYPTMALFNTTFNTYLAVSSLQHTAEACGPGRDLSWNCNLARANSAMMFSFAGTGAAGQDLGVRQKALETFNAAKTGGDAVKLAQLREQTINLASQFEQAQITGQAARTIAAQKWVARLAFPVFTANAVDTCSKTGVYDVNCLTAIGMAGTTFMHGYIGRNLPPVSKTIAGVTYSYDVPMLAINAGLLAAGCNKEALAADPFACVNAVGFSVMGLGVGGRPGGIPEIERPVGEEPQPPRAGIDPKSSSEIKILETERAYGELLAKQKADPASVTQEQVKAAENAYRAAIGTAVPEDAWVRLALEPKFKDAPATPKELELSRAQKEYLSRKAAYDNLVAGGKSAGDLIASPELRAYLEAKNTLIVTGAGYTLERTLLTFEPRSAVDRFFDRLLRRTVPAKLATYYKAAEAYRKAAQDSLTAKGRGVARAKTAYLDAFNKLVEAKEAAQLAFYTETERAIAADIKELRTKRDALRSNAGAQELAALDQEIAALYRQKEFAGTREGQRIAEEAKSTGRNPLEAIAEELAARTQKNIAAAQRGVEKPRSRRVAEVLFGTEEKPTTLGRATQGIRDLISRSIIEPIAGRRFAREQALRLAKGELNLTSEARETIKKLAGLYEERGVSALDKTTKGSQRESLLSFEEPIIDPTDSSRKITQIRLTEAGQKAGLVESDIKFINDTINSIERLKGYTVRTEGLLEQSRYIVSFLESLGSGNPSRIYGALMGLGKTDFVIPINALLQAKLTAEVQFIIFPETKLLNQFLENKGNPRAMADLFGEALGDPNKVVIVDSQNPPSAEAIRKGSVFIGTRDIAFALDAVDTPTGKALRTKWQGAYVHSDEGHWSLNPLESYRTSIGTETNVLDLAFGKEIKGAIERVRQLSSVNELIEARKNNTLTEVERNTDGTGSYSKLQEAKIIQEWLTAKNAASELPQELQALIGETNLSKVRTALDSYLNSHPLEATGTLGQELTVINKLADVLAARPQVDYGPAPFARTKGEIVLMAPREDNVVTGRQYQGTVEQLLYNTVGADIIGRPVDLTQLKVSSQSRDINFARLMQEVRGLAVYTGTPELVAPLFEQAYGIKLAQFTDPAYSLLKRNLVTDIKGGAAQVFKEIKTAIETRLKSNKSLTIINLNDQLDNKVTLAEVTKYLPDGKRVFVIGANGKFTEHVIESAGLKEIKTYKTNTELNDYTKTLDAKGERYVKFYEFGAHTGIDTKNPVEITQGIILTSEKTLITETVFSQGAFRIRWQNGDPNLRAPLDIVYGGNKGLEGLTELLSLNQRKAVAVTEVRFKETLLRNSVDQLFERLIAESGKEGFLRQPDLTTRDLLIKLQDSWRKTGELAYNLDKGEINAEAKLQRTLERVVAMYREVGAVAERNPYLRAVYEMMAKNIDTLAIKFAPDVNAVRPLFGTPALADVVTFINVSTDAKRLAGVNFTERGADAGVITADALAARTIGGTGETETALAAIKPAHEEQVVRPSLTKPSTWPIIGGLIRRIRERRAEVKQQAPMTPEQAIAAVQKLAFARQQVVELQKQRTPKALEKADQVRQQLQETVDSDVSRRLSKVLADVGITALVSPDEAVVAAVADFETKAVELAVTATTPTVYGLIKEIPQLQDQLSYALEAIKAKVGVDDIKAEKILDETVGSVIAVAVQASRQPVGRITAAPAGRLSVVLTGEYWIDTWPKVSAWGKSVRQVPVAQRIASTWGWLNAKPEDGDLNALGITKEKGFLGGRENIGLWTNATPFGMGRNGKLWNATYAKSRYGWAETVRWALTRSGSIPIAGKLVAPLLWQVPGIGPVLTVTNQGLWYWDITRSVVWLYKAVRPTRTAIPAPVEDYVVTLKTSLVQKAQDEFGKGTVEAVVTGIIQDEIRNNLQAAPDTVNVAIGALSVNTFNDIIKTQARQIVAEAQKNPPAAPQAVAPAPQQPAAPVVPAQPAASAPVAKPSAVVHVASSEIIGRLSDYGGISGGAVSRRHAIVYRDVVRNVLGIADYNSTNGTFVNGERLNGYKELVVGDTVILGIGATGHKLIVRQISGRKELVSGSVGVIHGQSTKAPPVSVMHTSKLAEVMETGNLQPVDGDVAARLRSQIEIHGGEYRSRQLVVNDLYSRGLAPKYSLKIDSVQYYVSDPYDIGQGRLAFVVYVASEGRLIARTYYRSNSATAWRFLPGYTIGDNGRIDWYSKGYGEEGINAPMVLQKLLSNVTQQSSVRRITDAEFIFAGLSAGRRMTDTYIREVWDVGEFISINKTVEEGKDLPRPESLTFVNPSDGPDFNAYLSTWDEDTSLYGLVTKESFLSKNGHYVYVFYRDSRSRAGLAFIENRSKITSLGIRERWVEAGALTTPIFEYNSQAGGYGNDKLRSGRYVDMYQNYLSKIPVIAEYQRLIGRNQKGGLVLGSGPAQWFEDWAVKYIYAKHPDARTNGTKPAWLLEGIRDTGRDMFDALRLRSGQALRNSLPAVAQRAKEGVRGLFGGQAELQSVSQIQTQLPAIIKDVWDAQAGTDILKPERVDEFIQLVKISEKYKALMAGRSPTEEEQTQIDAAIRTEIEKLQKSSKTWIDDLPIPWIWNPGGGGDSNSGETLMLYANNWDGAWDTGTSTLTLTPKVVAGVEVRGDEYYDTRFATVENGVIVPKSNTGYKRLPTFGTGYSRGFDVTENDVPTTSGNDRLIFRGVNYEAMQKIVSMGTITPGEVVGKIGKEGQVFFSVQPYMAFGYAADRGKFDMSQFDKPSFVVVMKWPEGVSDNGSSEVILKEPIPLDQILRIYEIRPYAIQAGHIRLFQDRAGQYMSLPEVEELSITAPIGQFVFREITLQELREQEFQQKFAVPAANAPISEPENATKKSPFRDYLVRLIGSRRNWFVKLVQTIAHRVGLVKWWSVDLPGVEPGRLGLTNQSSEPAKPTPIISIARFFGQITGWWQGLFVSKIDSTVNPKLAVRLREKFGAYSEAAVKAKLNEWQKDIRDYNDLVKRDYGDSLHVQIYRWIGPAGSQKELLVQAITRLSNEAQDVQDFTHWVLLEQGISTVTLYRGIKIGEPIIIRPWDSLTADYEIAETAFSNGGRVIGVEVPIENIFTFYRAHPSFEPHQTEQEYILNDKGIQAAKLVSIDNRLPTQEELHEAGTLMPSLITQQLQVAIIVKELQPQLSGRNFSSQVALETEVRRLVEEYIAQHNDLAPPTLDKAQKEAIISSVVSEILKSRNTTISQPAPQTLMTRFQTWWQGVVAPIRQFLGRLFPSLLPPAGTQTPQPTGRSPPSVDVMTGKVLDNLSIDFDKLGTLPYADQITSFIKRRLIDPGFQKIWPSAVLPQDPAITAEIRAQYENNRPAIPVFRSFVLPQLLRKNSKLNALNIDFINIRGANDVGGTPANIVGDYLIYDVIKAIEAELGEDYVVVRTGGDEFTILTEQAITPEFTSRVEATAGRVKSLYKEGNSIVYKPAAVHITAGTPAAQRTIAPQPELSLGILANRLAIYHREMIPIMESVIEGNLLPFFSEMLFDPVLSSDVDTLKAQGTNIEVFHDRTDFLSHLEESSVRDFNLLRIDLPGILKYINDRHGYEAGNDLLRYILNTTAPALAKIVGPDTHIGYFRPTGSDFYIELPGNIEVTDAMIAALKDAIVGQRAVVIAHTKLALIADTTPGPNPDVMPENERALSVAQETLAESVWEGTIVALRNFYTQNPTDSDWDFLAYYLNPYERRGANRLARLGTPLVEELKKHYTVTADGTSGVKEGDLEALKQLFMQILSVEPSSIKTLDNQLTPVYEQSVKMKRTQLIGNKSNIFTKALRVLYLPFHYFGKLPLVKQFIQFVKLVNTGLIFNISPFKEDAIDGLLGAGIGTTPYQYLMFTVSTLLVQSSLESESLMTLFFPNFRSAYWMNDFLSHAGEPFVYFGTALRGVMSVVNTISEKIGFRSVVDTSVGIWNTLGAGFTYFSIWTANEIGLWGPGASPTNIPRYALGLMTGFASSFEQVKYIPLGRFSFINSNISWEYKRLLKNSTMSETTRMEKLALIVRKRLDDIRKLNSIDLQMRNWLEDHDFVDPSYSEQDKQVLDNAAHEAITILDALPVAYVDAFISKDTTKIKQVEQMLFDYRSRIALLSHSFPYNVRSANENKLYNEQLYTLAIEAHEQPITLSLLSKLWKQLMRILQSDCIVDSGFIAKVYADDGTVVGSACRPQFMSPIRFMRYMKDHPTALQDTLSRFKASGGVNKRATDFCLGGKGIKGNFAAVLCGLSSLGMVNAFINNILPFFTPNICDVSKLEVLMYRLSLQYGFTLPKSIQSKITNCRTEQSQQGNPQSPPIVDRRSEWVCENSSVCKTAQRCIDDARGLDAHHGRTFMYENRPMICVDGQFTNITTAQCVDDTSLAVGYADQTEIIACGRYCIPGTENIPASCEDGDEFYRDRDPMHNFIFDNQPATEATCLNPQTLYRRTGDTTSLNVCQKGCSSSRGACFEDIMSVVPENVQPYQYFCLTDTFVGQALPNGQMRDVGKCYEGTQEKCVNGLCIPQQQLIASGEYRVDSDGTIPGIEYTGLAWKTAGEMLGRYGAMYAINPSEQGKLLWSELEMKRIFDICRQIPDYFCDGATFTKFASSDNPYHVDPYSIGGLSRGTHYPGIWLSYIYINNKAIIHELLHSADDIRGNSEKTLSLSSLYTEYAMLTGDWQFNSQTYRREIEYPEISLNPDLWHANTDITEHFATLGQQYMENSVRFADVFDFKYPGLYEFFRDKVFAGRVYKNYECVEGCGMN